MRAQASLAPPVGGESRSLPRTSPGPVSAQNVVSWDVDINLIGSLAQDSPKSHMLCVGDSPPHILPPLGTLDPTLGPAFGGLS